MIGDLASRHPMHFSLRTLLIAMTAAAVYVGGLLGLYRSFDSSGVSSPFVAMQAVCGLPIFILWCVAGEWAFRRRSHIPAARLMFAAILTAAAWRLCSPFFQAMFFRYYSLNSGGSVNAVQWYSAIATLLHSLFEFASWFLMTFAIIRATKATPKPDASPWESEIP
jgi:hypothetical protein